MTDLPSNIEAEQALLGAVLVNNETMHKIPDLEADHFFDPVHARLFEAMQKKIAADELVSPITMKHFATSDSGMAELGGANYLVRMAGASTSPLTAPAIAATIIELAARRSLIIAAREAIERAGDAQGGAVDEIRADLEGKLADSYDLNGKDAPFATIMESVVAAVDAANEAYKGGTPRGAQCGLKSIDEYLGAFKPGQVYIIAGRPSMGKTAIALNIASRVDGVVFASLEMTDEALANRLISQKLREGGANIPYRNIENGWLNEADFRQVVEASMELKSANMITIKPGNSELSKLLSSIRSAARQVKKRGELRMIVLDFLQLVSVRGASKFDAIGEVTKAFKAIALQYDIPVVVLSQINRGVESRDDKRPVLSDLRGSGEIEEHGDNILFCYRPAYYLEREINGITDIEAKADAHADLAAMQNSLELIVAKQKNGKIGTIHLGCEVKFNHLYDKEEQSEAAF